MTQSIAMEGLSWQDVMGRVSALADRDAEGAEDVDPVAVAVAQHLLAGVRAFVVATHGDEGVAIRYSKVGPQALVVVQPITRRDDHIAAVGDPTFRMVHASQAWQAIAGYLPQAAIFGASVIEGSFQGRDLAPGDDGWANEVANLQMSVEAWPTPERPVRSWAHWWSVIGEHLYDLRLRDGSWIGVERPRGSVAAEFEWAVAGATDVLASAQRSADAE